MIDVDYIGSSGRHSLSKMSRRKESRGCENEICAYVTFHFFTRVSSLRLCTHYALRITRYDFPLLL